MALCAGHLNLLCDLLAASTPWPNVGEVLKALCCFTQQARHDGVLLPLYGNCQAGWAARLLAAACHGLAGPIVLYGWPLLY